MTFTIAPYQPAYAPAFDRLNRAWIEEYFTVEPFDHAVLTNPERYILQGGGELWFAVEQGQAIGCCALLKLEDGLFEFTKLGVDPAARGRGVARALLRHCATRAHNLGAHTLRIYTSLKLTPANALYVSEGFVRKPHDASACARYARCDVMYDRPLTHVA